MAGLQVGDRIISVDGIPVSGFDQTVDLIQARPGQTVTIGYERDGQTFETTATLNDHNPEGKAVGFLGVGAALSLREPVDPVSGHRRRHPVQGPDLGLDPRPRIVLLAERPVRLRRHAARQPARRSRRVRIGVERQSG